MQILRTLFVQEGFRFRPSNCELATDPHSLPKYRTNATLQNMPEFHRRLLASVAIRWYVRRNSSVVYSEI